MHKSCMRWADKQISQEEPKFGPPLFPPCLTQSLVPVSRVFGSHQRRDDVAYIKRFRLVEPRGARPSAQRLHRNIPELGLGRCMSDRTASNQWLSTSGQNISTISGSWQFTVGLYCYFSNLQRDRGRFQGTEAVLDFSVTGTRRASGVVTGNLRGDESGGPPLSRDNMRSTVAARSPSRIGMSHRTTKGG